VPGVNNFRPIPEYREGDSIPFAGAGEWNDRARLLNAASGADAADEHTGESPVEAAMHMVSRLREGTVTR
jgi:hypothetical protein